MFNVFQQPWTLLAVAAVVFLIVIVCRPKRELLIALVLALLAVGLDFFVATDYEKIKGAISAGLEGIKTKQIEPIDQIIANDYHDELSSSKAAIIAYCEAIFQIAPIERIIRRGQEITIEGEKAEAVLRAWVFFGADGELEAVAEQALLVKMRLYLRKDQDKQWRIYTSEMLELNNNATSWRQLH